MHTHMYIRTYEAYDLIVYTFQLTRFVYPLFSIVCSIGKQVQQLHMLGRSQSNAKEPVAHLQPPELFLHIICIYIHTNDTAVDERSTYSSR